MVGPSTFQIVSDINGDGLRWMPTVDAIKEDTQHAEKVYLNNAVMRGRDLECDGKLPVFGGGADGDVIEYYGMVAPKDPDLQILGGDKSTSQYPVPVALYQESSERIQGASDPERISAEEKGNLSVTFAPSALEDGSSRGYWASRVVRAEPVSLVPPLPTAVEDEKLMTVDTPSVPEPEGIETTNIQLSCVTYIISK